MPRKPKAKAKAAAPPQTLGDPASPRQFLFDWFSDMEAHLAESLARADAASADVGGDGPPLQTPPLQAPTPVRQEPVPYWLHPAYATVDPESLDFGSDDDMVGVEDTSGAVLASSSPPPSTTVIPGVNLWDPDVTMVSIDTVPPMMSSSRLTSRVCPVSSLRGHGLFLTVGQRTCTTLLLLNPPLCVRRAPGRSVFPPLLGLTSVASSRPSPLTSLTERCGLLHTCY